MRKIVKNGWLAQYAKEREGIIAIVHFALMEGVLIVMKNDKNAPSVMAQEKGICTIRIINT